MRERLRLCSGPAVGGGPSPKAAGKFHRSSRVPPHHHLSIDVLRLPRKITHHPASQSRPFHNFPEHLQQRNQGFSAPSATWPQEPPAPTTLQSGEVVAHPSCVSRLPTHPCCGARRLHDSPLLLIPVTGLSRPPPTPPACSSPVLQGRCGKGSALSPSRAESAPRLPWHCPSPPTRLFPQSSACNQTDSRIFTPHSEL